MSHLDVLLCFASAGGIGLVLVGYPLLLWLRAARAPAPRAFEPPPAPPSVSVLVAVRNGEALIGDKLRNTLALRYPPDRVQVVVASDGSTDATIARIREVRDPRINVLELLEHRGKTEALNLGALRCRGDVVVFTDADALLDPDALAALIEPFRDPTIGGVCGQRVIQRGEGRWAGAQRGYVSWDSRIKLLESRLGSVSSNDGKLYAVRRELLRPIVPAVTDDLFNALSVVRQGARFVFEPRATARIRLPSRSLRHEVRRRRRIVGRSLRGILHERALLNPVRFGWFAVGLTINKVLRRMLPVFGAAFALSAVSWGLRFPAAHALWAVPAAGLGLAAAGAALPDRPWARPPRAASRAALYFAAGNLGTALGLWDAVRGHRITKWDPHKGTPAPSPRRPSTGQPATASVFNASRTNGSS